jgi:hypothetical protein
LNGQNRILTSREQELEKRADATLEGCLCAHGGTGLVGT